MTRGEKRKRFFLFMLAALFLRASSGALQAVPSFARQTGFSCNECHTVFPELTPFGRSFKLGGYAMSRSGKPYAFPPPLAGMAQASYSGAKGLTSGVAPFDSSRRDTARINLPQQLSLFYGGRIFDRIGAFVQVTYDGVENGVALDMTDIRYADSTTLWGKNLVYGFTINNSPTVQDAWNTTPAWEFPFASSSVAPTPAAATTIHGTLNQQVGGVGAYVFWNNLIYLGGTVYRTARNGITRPLGAGSAIEQVVDGAAPYWRLVLEKRWKNHFFTIGTYGIRADLFPAGNASGPTDRFSDIAFDAQYQYMGSLRPKGGHDAAPAAGKTKAGTGNHIITAHATWIHENQDRRGSVLLGAAANATDFLDTFRMNLNYYHRGRRGAMVGSIGYFSIAGKADPLLYAANPVDGSRTGSPGSSGFIVEADYRPWDKVKISLQYIFYNQFNGARRNYDGSGRDAADNNTFYAVVWLLL